MNRLLIGKRLPILALVLAVVGAIAVVRIAPPAAARNIDEAGLVLAKLDDAWSEAAATRDAAKVAAFYAEDAIAYPPNAPIAIGRGAAQKVWASYFAEPSFNISWKSDHAEVAASGDLGFTAGAYIATYNGPNGKSVTEHGKFLCTWRKQADGTWLAAHDMWNADAK